MENLHLRLNRINCATNEVLGRMITHTNTLTKHYYIQSSATLLPPPQRDLYPNAAPLITLHGLFHESADLPLYQDKHKRTSFLFLPFFQANFSKQIRFFNQTVKRSEGVAQDVNLRNA